MIQVFRAQSGAVLQAEMFRCNGEFAIIFGVHTSQ